MVSRDVSAHYPSRREQKATWLQIRQHRPDYVLLWGWGVMNSTAIKEAVAVGYPREKMYDVWWSGAEQEVPRDITPPPFNTRQVNSSCTRT
jgi:branched-chain amino acid transport system substrate-binding protein